MSPAADLPHGEGRSSIVVAKSTLRSKLCHDTFHAHHLTALVQMWSFFTVYNDTSHPRAWFLCS